MENIDIKIKETVQELNDLMNGVSNFHYQQVDIKIDKPHQRIFFGAPGTGKSYLLNKEAKKYFGENFDRVTFHPNYMYGNFIGAFKPFPKKIKDEKGAFVKDEYNQIKEIITYKYVPGALMKVLVKALVYKENNYLLLIEEINRANVAAVFGDFFQLLDRKASGESEYPIATSEDVKLYLEEYFENEDLSEEQTMYIKSKLGENFDRLILPSNLYIWSTMNSEDQGVMPMDTAFKRRWDFTYIGVNNAVDSDFEKYKFKITENELVKWDDFRRQVNDRLSNCKVSEDKLMGPYFISKSILSSGDEDKITDVVADKVLMYLYEDAGKAYRNNLFVAEKAKTYSTLCEAFRDNGQAIFNKPLTLDTFEQPLEVDAENNNELYPSTTIDPNGAYNKNSVIKKDDK